MANLLSEELIVYFNKRIEQHRVLNNLQTDTFLRKCLVCYTTWREGFECTTKDCTQHAWCIDYNDWR